MNKLFLTASAAALMLGTATFAQAAGAGVKVGMLTCKVEPGWSYVVGSTKALECSYSPTKGKPERYYGDIQKVGLDLGYSDGATMVWAVIAPTSDVGKDALEGNYAGVAASVAVGVGAGAKVLIGGLDKSITLQPLSVEGDTGVNLAVGVAAINLKHF
ncbi:MAG: DUF992 domain-containing protein [Alphaproteobacteria bacterium]|nr:DUF992 domain-containing protein [Alphaproteobacteria bacterium]